VSFSLDGRLLSWQNWQMRLGFNYREGLVLHTVGFRDGRRLRPVAHRLSFAEMIVPYRDPTDDHYRRTAFDIGDPEDDQRAGQERLGESRRLQARPDRLLSRDAGLRSPRVPAGRGGRAHGVVTPYRADERWPCGDFPNLSEHDAGLPRWTAQNRSIENTDVVLWPSASYVFGIHHITRPEDCPSCRSTAPRSG